jgi:hypothetical protein
MKSIHFILHTHVMMVMMMDSGVIIQGGEEVDSTMKKIMTMFSPHFGIFIVERYLDDDDKGEYDHGTAGDDG